MFLGNTKFEITAVKNTTATQFSANTFLMISGKISKISGTCVKPIPILRDNATINKFL